MEKKLVSSLFFILIIFLFSAKSGVGAGAQKSGGAAALPAPPTPRSLQGHRKIALILKMLGLVWTQIFSEGIRELQRKE